MLLPTFSREKFRLALGFSALLLIPLLARADNNLGVLFQDQDDAYWSVAATTITDVAKQKNLEPTVRTLSPDPSAGAQARALKALASNGKLDALILNLPALNLFKTEITTWANSGTKLIVLEGAAPGGLKHIQVGTPPAGLDDTGAWLFSPLVGDTDEVAIVGGPGGAQERKALEVLQYTHPRAIVRQVSATANDQPDAIANRLLTQYPKISAIYATNLPMTQAVIRVLKEKKLQGKVKVIGCGSMIPDDIRKALANDTLHGWVSQEPLQTAQKAVEIASDIFRGKTPPSVIAISPYLAITKDNLTDPRVQQLLQN